MLFDGGRLEERAAPNEATGKRRLQFIRRFRSSLRGVGGHGVRKRAPAALLPAVRARNGGKSRSDAVTAVVITINNRNSSHRRPSRLTIFEAGRGCGLQLEAARRTGRGRKLFPSCLCFISTSIGVEFFCIRNINALTREISMEIEGLRGVRLLWSAIETVKTAGIRTA